jgi:hypothetical protein
MNTENHFNEYLKKSNEQLKKIKEDNKIIDIEEEDFLNIKNKYFNTNYSLCLYFVKLYKNIFIVNNDVLYYYNNVYWEIDNNKSKPNLNKYLSSNFFNDVYLKIGEKINNLNNYILKTIGDTKKDLLDELKLIQVFLNKIITILTNTKKRNELIPDILNLLINNNIKFDTKRNLFAFNNKIYDLFKDKFIEPKFDDYISITTNYNYEENINLENDKNELHKILNTIFTDHIEKDYYLK